MEDEKHSKTDHEHSTAAPTMPPGYEEELQANIAALKTGKFRTLATKDGRPVTSELTKKVAALIAVGFPPPIKKSYSDIVRQKLGGAEGEVERETLWLLSEGNVVKFNPIAAPGEMTFQEVFERVMDPEWIASNPEHPLAYVGQAMVVLQELHDKMTGRHPKSFDKLVEMKIGGTTLRLPTRLPEEEKQAWIRDAKKAERERRRRKGGRA